MLQVIVSVGEGGQIQVSTTQPLGVDRILGILELGKMAALEVAKNPAPGIEVANPAAQKALLHNGIGK